MRKFALLSMDVEDWYHLEYFRTQSPSRHVSTLDGLQRFADVLSAESVSATFFTVGDVATQVAPQLRELAAGGHEIASHGPDHKILHDVPATVFASELRAHKASLEDVVGREVVGYRAPCFSLDRAKLDRLSELGFLYDSSRIDFTAHPLYGSIDLSGWQAVAPGIHREPGSGLVEFEIPTVTAFGRRLPVAGGAYFRFAPWALTAALVRRYLRTAGVYLFYIHPFECSDVQRVPYPAETRFADKLRFQTGRRATLDRLRGLIHMLRSEGFEFSTYASVASEIADAAR